MAPQIQCLSYFTAFLSAAGYASSSVLYNLSIPQFIYGSYTVTPFQVSGCGINWVKSYYYRFLQVPTSAGANGTVTANTTAIKTDPNCHLMTTVYLLFQTTVTCYSFKTCSNPHRLLVAGRTVLHSTAVPSVTRWLRLPLISLGPMLCQTATVLALLTFSFPSCCGFSHTTVTLHKDQRPSAAQISLCGTSLLSLILILAIWFPSKKLGHLTPVHHLPHCRLMSPDHQWTDAPTMASDSI